MIPLSPYKSLRGRGIPTMRARMLEVMKAGSFTVEDLPMSRTSAAQVIEENDVVREVSVGKYGRKVYSVDPDVIDAIASDFGYHVSQQVGHSEEEVRSALPHVGWFDYVEWPELEPRYDVSDNAVMMLYEAINDDSELRPRRLWNAPVETWVYRGMKLGEEDIEKYVEEVIKGDLDHDQFVK